MTPKLGVWVAYIILDGWMDGWDGHLLIQMSQIYPIYFKTFTYLIRTQRIAYHVSMMFTSKNSPRLCITID